MKEKISITIDKDLIGKVDSVIDGINVRNRSQALEHLIRKGIKEKSTDSAIILAGGNIKTLKFSGTYKPLVKVEGVPIILNTIKKLKEVGVKKILIASGPITDKIFELVGDGSEYGVEIIYIQDKNSGTAGVVKKASRYLNSSFFVISGDVYFDFDLKKMIDFHQMANTPATIAISVTTLKHSKDAVKIMGNKVIDFQYEPKAEKTHYSNAGVYLFEPKMIDMIPKKGSLEKDVLPKLTKTGKLTGFVFSGKWEHLI